MLCVICIWTGSFGFRRKLFYSPARVLDLFAGGSSSPDASASSRPPGPSAAQPVPVTVSSEAVVGSAGTPETVTSASGTGSASSSHSTRASSAITLENKTTAAVPSNHSVGASSDDALRSHPIMARFAVRSPSESDKPVTAPTSVGMHAPVSPVDSRDVEVMQPAVNGTAHAVPTVTVAVNAPVARAQSRSNTTAEPNDISPVNRLVGRVSAMGQPAMLMASPLEQGDGNTATLTAPATAAAGVGAAPGADMAAHEPVPPQASMDQTGTAQSSSEPLGATGAGALTMAAADTMPAATPSEPVQISTLPSTLPAAGIPAPSAAASSPSEPVTSTTAQAQPTTPLIESKSWYDSLALPSLNPAAHLRSLSEHVATQPAVLSANLHAYGKLKAGYSVPLLTNFNFGELRFA